MNKKYEVYMYHIQLAPITNKIFWKHNYNKCSMQMDNVSCHSLLVTTSFSYIHFIILLFYCYLVKWIIHCTIDISLKSKSSIKNKESDITNHIEELYMYTFQHMYTCSTHVSTHVQHKSHKRTLLVLSKCRIQNMKCTCIIIQ